MTESDARAAEILRLAREIRLVDDAVAAEYAVLDGLADQVARLEPFAGRVHPLERLLVASSSRISDLIRAREVLSDRLGNLSP